MILRYCIFAILFLLTSCAHGPPGQTYPAPVFLLHSQASPEKAQTLSAGAEDFLISLGSYLKIEAPPGALLRIYHYRWRWGLWYYLTQAAPSYCWRPAVCFETREAYHIAISGRPESSRFSRNLYHELTHYLLTVHYSYLPPWLDEGIAQIISSGPPFPRLKPTTLSAVARTLETRYQDNCRQVALYPPNKLMSASEYHLACALTYYLIQRDPESINRFHSYLSRMNPQEDQQTIFSEEWGISIEEACRNLAPFYQTLESN